MPHLTKRIAEVRAQERHALDIVQSAIDRGDFELARGRVRELAGTTPDSPRVAEATSRIDRVEAEAHHAEQMVLTAIRAGEFEQARTHVRLELARVTPMSPRVFGMEKEIEQAQAAAQRAERLVLAAIDRGRAREGQEARAGGVDERDSGLPAGGEDGEEDRTRAGRRAACGAGNRQGDRTGGLRGSPDAREDACGPDSELTASGEAERLDRRGAGVGVAFRRVDGGGDSSGAISRKHAGS